MFVSDQICIGLILIKWAVFGALDPPPFELLNTRMNVRTAAPINNKAAPTLGWYLSQATEVTNKKIGIATNKAAKKIANPTTPLIKPPTRGI